METLEASAGALSLAELSRQSGLPKPTVYRLSGQLVNLGALDQNASGCYRLGTRLFEFGNNVVGYRQLREMAVPYMQDLYEATHQTVNLGIPHRGQVLYVEKLSPHAKSKVSTRVGRSKPMHCTALGKAILAFSDIELMAENGDGPLPRHTPTHTEQQAGLDP